MVIVKILQNRRWTRREFAGTLGAATAAATATTLLPSVAHADALAAALGGVSEATAGKAAGMVGGLRLLPPDEAPYDTSARRELARDALTFFVRQQGNYPGRSAYQLPAAPWFGGNLDPATRYAWDMNVPGSAPLYLLAAADDGGSVDPSKTTVIVNGETISDLSPYVHSGVTAISYGFVRDFAVLDLVFAPPAPGRYHVEVRTKYGHYAPVASPGTPWPDETVVAYDITVGASDALSRFPLRDPSGSLYVFSGAELRRVPDEETFNTLGYTDRPLAASSGFVAALPQGADLPTLRDGMLVQSDPNGPLFRLRDRKRQWIRVKESVNGESASLIDGTTLQTIPPVLQDDMLLKGAAVDVFHVDRGTLRKIPDGNWVNDHGLDIGNLIYVPDRIFGTLPQNSPEWRLPSGTVQDRTFDSAALGRSMVYRVYLPAGYDRPENAGQRYPVLYLLHGLSGRYDEWDGYGVSEVANALAYDGKFPPAIMVMPQGGLGYWMNQDGGAAWADYVAKDLVGHVDSTYRTIPRREARGIGGLSMGAHGAVQIALNYPDVFSIVGAHSPSIRGTDSAPAFFGTGDSFAHHDPLSLVQTSRVANPPQLWIDAGQDDFWRASASALHQALQAKGWAHEYHVYPGGHDGWYWGDHLWDYLPFYAQALAKNGIR